MFRIIVIQTGDKGILHEEFFHGYLKRFYKPCIRESSAQTAMTDNKI